MMWTVRFSGNCLDKISSLGYLWIINGWNTAVARYRNASPKVEPSHYRNESHDLHGNILVTSSNSHNGLRCCYDYNLLALFLT